MKDQVRADPQPPRQTSDTTVVAEGISSNPGAVDVRTGTGELAESIEALLGLPRDTGVFLGGVWVADGNCTLTGGVDPGQWSFNRLLILGAGLDAEKVVGWPGGRFGVEFLQFNGEHTNRQAGSVQGYNSLPGPDPLHRSELYQLWWRQELFDRKLVLRFGKVAPTDDFNNVLRPVPVHDQHLAIPAVSGLLYTPVFVNPTLLGVMRGYYNSAYGITTTFTPVRNLYLSYGIYDGNIANQVQTGLHNAPNFNGYYFHIAEAGGAWDAGLDRLPLAAGIRPGISAPGSPDPVPERAQMLKGCDLYVNGAPCPMCMSDMSINIPPSRSEVAIQLCPPARTEAPEDLST